MTSKVLSTLNTFTMLIAQPSSIRKEVIAKAKDTYQTTMKSTGEPDPRGEIIAKHNYPKDIQEKWKTFGYHASNLDRWKDQIKSGKVADIGIKLYLGVPLNRNGLKIASHFAANGNESVILDIASESGIVRNDIFNTYYVPSSNGNYIRIAYKVSEEWLNYVNNPSMQMSTSARVGLSLSRSIEKLINETNQLPK
ncbi:hypothetical protein [Candidatus Neptunichlamydia sp. REUL1]|uniref:hypothetical protein n=1 Tax=Candidatus Neptunichlamydia sp. REUL1 TaxID=3064277 RepID=UPI00293180ED|nr:hypothetical protein [Candidatus Neptunochlamydia sp. REUL1]